MSDGVKQFWQELRDHWDDPYWRADHPEFNALLVTVITGLVGLVFMCLQIVLKRRLEK